MLILSHYNFYIVVLIILLGLWAMIAKNNLIKKIMGMAIFQTGIILFYISMGAKKGSTIPIIDTHGHHDYYMQIDSTLYANPLTHILMLTAIVVGVATVGLALTVIQKVYEEHGTIEENEILEKK